MEARVLRIEKEINIKELIEGFNEKGISIHCEMEKQGNLTVILIEKYYMRNSSFACCSVSIYSHSPLQHDVIIMSGGASESVLFNFSFGANYEFIEDICQVLTSI